MSGGSGGVWLMCSGVCVLSGGCLGGVRWRLEGVLDPFLDPGTLGLPPGHTGIQDPGSDRVY